LGESHFHELEEETEDRNLEFEGYFLFCYLANRTFASFLPAALMIGSIAMSTLQNLALKPIRTRFL
jgi:hypothetical protein